MSTERKSLVVVDDHSIFRMGVIQAVADSDTFEIVGQGTSRVDAVQLVATLKPDLALLDISMPGGGLEAAEEIRRNAPLVRAVMLTVSEEENDVIRALDAGVAGYILKGISAEQLVGILKLVADGQTYFPPDLGLRMINSLRAGQASDRNGDLIVTLSPKERLTLRFIKEGLNNREIANAMGVQVKTIKFHVTNLLQKLGMRNRVEAAIFAQKYLK